jgi:GNAT superfamily N-acetyltransferase
VTAVLTFRELGADPSDLAILRTFYDTLYVAEFPDPDERETLANMADYLRRKDEGWYGRNSYHIVLGLAGGEIVAASVSDYLAEPNTGVVEFIVVAPAGRGSGVGGRLLAHTEALFDQDAWRAHGRPADAVLAEMNDPFATSALSDNLDPVARTLIWHRWGFGGLDFPYVQPALSTDQEPVRNLILICKPCRGDWSSAVPAPVVASTVHEYLRWAMRINEPAESAEFRRMAEVLGSADTVGLMPLDRYVGRGEEVDVRSALDEPEFDKAMALYRATFPPGPATVPESAFRDARGEPGYHLWTVRAAQDDAEPAGLASFFTLPAAGFVGYVALTDSLHGAGLLRGLVARIETQLLAERAEVRGWYAEVAQDVDITPYLRIGAHELAVDYRQPAPDLPLRLVFRAPGRSYAPPRLAARDLLTDIEGILSTVYRIAEPRAHATYRRVAAGLPDPDDDVPLR